MKDTKIHYAWVICFAGVLMLFCSIGLAANVFSVYQPYIIEINKYSYTQGSMLVTMRMASALMSLFLIDKYYNALGIRVGASLAIGSIALAYLIFGFSDQYWMYAVGAFISGIGYSLGAMIPVSLVVNKWFNIHKALALGICSAGTGIATVIMPPVVTALINNIGLKYAFLSESALIFAIAIIIFVLIRNQPAELNMEPLGKEVQIKTDKKQGRYVLSKKQWYAIIFILFLLGGGGSNGFTHLGVLFTSENYDSMQVARIISMMGILLGIGKCILGEIYDRIGSYRANYIFGVLAIFGSICCCLSPLHNRVILVIGIITLGFGFPINNVGVPIWAADFSGARSYEKVLKRFQIAYTCGTMFFSMVTGLSADIFDSYIPIYVLFTIIIAIFIIVLQTIYKKVTR